ncbi:hypothetical protein [Deinococcus marmoris]|uniref:Uncharacterized protein n=1 Tax=Deinococcus marmoris TaxID=249408 RepID=A0A1U7P302_9DEIO|nr:hypothetical protein [Deinococcus marmoris]OLV19536.1 hypothetical protein BOO71_0002347 [Deinococcus marmoris]
MELIEARLTGITTERDARAVNGEARIRVGNREIDGPAAYLHRVGAFVFIEASTSTGIGKAGETERQPLLCIAASREEAQALSDQVQGQVIRPGSPWRLESRAADDTTVGHTITLNVYRTRTAFR